MDDRQRKFVFVVILIVSLIVVAYLVFLTPSESRIDLPTPTASATEPVPGTPIATLGQTGPAFRSLTARPE